LVSAKATSIGCAFRRFHYVMQSGGLHRRPMGIGSISSTHDQKQVPDDPLYALLAVDSGRSAAASAGSSAGY
jgi:hypothetical protein